MLAIYACTTDNNPVYTLSVSPEPQIGGTVSHTEVRTQKGVKIQVTAKANEHWNFLHWSGDLVNNLDQPTINIEMDSDKQIVAIFEKVSYPLTVHIEGDGEVEQELLQAKTTDYQHGSVVRLTAVPDHGWEFVEWNGAVSGSETEVEIEIEGETDVTAIFKPIDYEITVEVAGEGRVDIVKVAAKTVEYPFGTILQLTAVPEEDWMFYKWSGDLEGSESVEVVEVSGPMTALATFITTPSVVTSTTIADLTENTARISAEVVANGGVDVTERGICWSTSENPTTDGNCTSVGSGLGTFATTLSGLIEDTKYYARGYAVNAAGTAYGNQVSFFTLAPVMVATVLTVEVTSVTTTSARVAGRVTDDGNSVVTERGICWSTSSEIPESFSGSQTADIDCRPSGDGLGDYSYTITGLEYGTHYYVRAYAINEVGYGIGEQKEFTTLNPELPAVTTLAVTSISSTSAQSGGEVTSDGGGIVSERGICWSTSQNPTVNDQCTSDGSGTGSYSSTMTGLSSNSSYHVRAYAVNGSGVSYGNNRQFQTSQSTSSPVSIETLVVTSITTNSATGGGNITNDGGSSITQRGICWSTSQNPTTSNSCTNSGSGTGTFSGSMSSLNSGTTYYVRAYAINSQELTYYGNQRSFVTESSTPSDPSGETVTDIDGNIYTVVRIGNQRWMASNLRTTRYRNGNQIPNVKNPANWTTRSTGAWAYYDNNAGYNGTYGKLYNWHAATDGRGICPAGWRVPSDADFQTMEAALGMPAGELGQEGHRGAAQNVGGKLKTTGNSLWREPISDPTHKYYNPDYQEATNSTGFSGVPNGNLNPVDTTHDGPGFYSILRDKDMWTSTPSGSNAVMRALSFNQSSVFRARLSKQFGFAVRCVQ